MSHKDQIAQEFMETAARALAAHENVEHHKSQPRIPTANANSGMQPSSVRNGEWKVMKNPLTRQTYYYNTVTKETRNTKPS